VISLTDFFTAASRRHNDVILLPAIRIVSGNDFVPAGQCTGHRLKGPVRVQQLNCCVKKRQTFLHQPAASRQPKSPSCRLRYLGCHAASCLPHTHPYSVDELKRRLIDVWCGLEQSIFDEVIDQWRGRHRACVHAKGGHSEYSL